MSTRQNYVTVRDSTTLSKRTARKFASKNFSGPTLSEAELVSEKWLPINRYEGRYEVSDMGRVKSIAQGAIPIKNGGYRTHRGGLIKLCLDRHGYVRFNAKRLGSLKAVYVHRAVASIFLPNPLALPAVNHLDGNPLNNRHSNLEWATHKENSRHAVKTGLIKTIPLKIRSQIAQECRAHLAQQGVTKIIAKKYGVSNGSVRNIISKNRKLALIIQSLNSCCHD